MALFDIKAASKASGEADDELQHTVPPIRDNLIWRLYLSLDWRSSRTLNSSSSIQSGASAGAAMAAASSMENMLENRPQQPEAPTQPPTTRAAVDVAASASGNIRTIVIGPNMAPQGEHPRIVSARRVASSQNGFRVGESNYGYEHYETDKSFNSKPVYRCIRGKSNKFSARLYLYRSCDGCWIATEAGEDDPDPVANGTAAFKTQDAIDDISVPVNRLLWQWFVPDSNQWVGSMAFNTYRLISAAGCLRRWVGPLIPSLGDPMIRSPPLG